MLPPVVGEARRPTDPVSLQLAIMALTRCLGGRFSENPNIRRQHANITSWHSVEAPDAVAFAESTEEVAAIVRICAEHNVPVIGFGVGSSLEGGVNAPYGGICIDLGGMNHILSVNAEDMDCFVQAGVTLKQLNSYIRDSGLFFSVDPGADASLGGMASTRASGTTTVRFGTMKDNVLALTVVMADGSVRKTGTRARKSAAGYDITRLFVGAEGTLGIITELAIKLHGIPAAIVSAVCSFADLKSACDAVITTIRSGIPMARIELLDEVQVKACNAYSKLALPEMPALFLEFHGTETGAAEQVQFFWDIAQEFGGHSFAKASTTEERNRIWQARHDVYWACLALRPGSKFIATDVCVPISRLAECLAETHRDIESSGLVAPIVGHVGDGNFHVSIMADVDDRSEMDRTTTFIGRLNQRAIAMEGTCTGEHGIGQGKREYLVQEHGANVDTMRAIKQALDPFNIMNPGKIFLS